MTARLKNAVAIAVQLKFIVIGCNKVSLFQISTQYGEIITYDKSNWYCYFLMHQYVIG